MNAEDFAVALPGPVDVTLTGEPTWVPAPLLQPAALASGPQAKKVTVVFEVNAESNKVLANKDFAGRLALIKAIQTAGFLAWTGSDEQGVLGSRSLLSKTVATLKGDDTTAVTLDALVALVAQTSAAMNFIRAH